MGDENPIHTLGDYSRPSHEGYRNTIELPEGNNVGPLRSDAIRLVQNGCSFHRLRSEDPNQHLKDFLKLVDSLDLDSPSPQPQALNTNFEARVWDYMAAHTERMERFENTIFKQRDEINGMMTEMFGLLKELTTSRTPKKVLIQEEAKFPVTKNLNSISLTKEEERGSDRTMMTPGNAEKPTETKTESPVMELEKINKLKSGAKIIKTSKNDKAVEAPNSQPVAYYLKHKINEKLIKGLVTNNRFNNSRSRTQVGKKKVKEYKVLPGGPAYDAILKKMITKKDDNGGNFEIPCSIGNLKRKSALVDQGSDVNVMPYSTYMRVTDEKPAETDIRLSLASHSYIYPLGITEDMKPDSSNMINKGVKNDIEPIAPTVAVSRLVREWEEKIKLHLEREMQFNQWRSKNFKGRHPALIATKENEMPDNEGEVTCQLDEQWFDLTKDTLKDALQITPVIINQAFTSPPSSDALINFVNELGYPKLVRNLSNVITNDMFQPWRALTTIINLRLTGKTFGFERPKASVCQLDEQWFDLTKDTLKDALQITPVIINQAFTSPPSSDALINFVNELGYPKLHKFHPRPDSLLHLPNEEPVLGYLKFSAKGTKREVFGVPIPGSLITAYIQEAPYHQEYLAKVAKHERYLAGETGSDPDSPALKPTKTAKKPKPTAPKADPRPPGIGGKLEDMYDVPRGPLPQVVIREPESEKYQPLLEVPGKGKEKVIKEEVARDLLTLQTPKKKSPADRYIFQRHTSSGHDESLSLYVELGLTDSEEESEEDVPGADAGFQGEGQVGPDLGAQDEGQAGSNPDEQAEGRARPDLGNAKASQLMPSVVVHAGSDSEHIDLDVVDVSIQPPPEQMDEGDKPLEADNDKATVEAEAESMVSVTIQQDMSSIPPMTTLIFDLASRPESPKGHQLLTATTTTTTTILPPPSQQQQSTTYAMMMKRINIPHQVSKVTDEVVTDAVDWAMQAPLQNCFRDLPEADMKEILHQRMWETDSYKTHEDHMQLYEALEKSMNRDHSEELAKDLTGARKKKKKSRQSQKTPPGSPPYQPPPPPPPPPAGPSGASGSLRTFGSPQVLPLPPPPPSINQEGQSKGSVAPRSSKTAASAEYQAWTTTVDIC
nr:MAK10-like protein [Tanacetum cinerariifolium]